MAFTPVQLPVLLQVLMSSDHLLESVSLLCRFLNLGAWSVRAALTVGIFPYIQRLTQNHEPITPPTPSLPILDTTPGSFVPPEWRIPKAAKGSNLNQRGAVQGMLAFSWAKLLAVDRDCQSDALSCGALAFLTQMLTRRAKLLHRSGRASALGKHAWRLAWARGLTPPDSTPTHPTTTHPTPTHPPHHPIHPTPPSPALRGSPLRGAFSPEISLADHPSGIMRDTMPPLDISAPHPATDGGGGSKVSVTAKHLCAVERLLGLSMAEVDAEISKDSPWLDPWHVVHPTAAGETGRVYLPPEAQSEAETTLPSPLPTPATSSPSSLRDAAYEARWAAAQAEDQAAAPDCWYAAFALCRCVEDFPVGAAFVLANGFIDAAPILLASPCKELRLWTAFAVAATLRYLPPLAAEEWAPALQAPPPAASAAAAMPFKTADTRSVGSGARSVRGGKSVGSKADKSAGVSTTAAAVPGVSAASTEHLLAALSCLIHDASPDVRAAAHLALQALTRKSRPDPTPNQRVPLPHPTPLHPDRGTIPSSSTTTTSSTTPPTLSSTPPAPKRPPIGVDPLALIVPPGDAPRDLSAQVTTDAVEIMEAASVRWKRQLRATLAVAEHVCQMRRPDPDIINPPCPATVAAVLPPRLAPIPKAPPSPSPLPSPLSDEEEDFVVGTGVPEKEEEEKGGGGGGGGGGEEGEEDSLSDSEEEDLLPQVSRSRSASRPPARPMSPPHLDRADSNDMPEGGMDVSMVGPTVLAMAPGWKMPYLPRLADAVRRDVEENALNLVTQTVAATPLSPRTTTPPSVQPHSGIAGGSGGSGPIAMVSTSSLGPSRAHLSPQLSGRRAPATSSSQIPTATIAPPTVGGGTSGGGGGGVSSGGGTSASSTSSPPRRPRSNSGPSSKATPDRRQSESRSSVLAAAAALSAPPGEPPAPSRVSLLRQASARSALAAILPGCSDASPWVRLQAAAAIGAVLREGAAREAATALLNGERIPGEDISDSASVGSTASQQHGPPSRASSGGLGVGGGGIAGGSGAFSSVGGPTTTSGTTSSGPGGSPSTSSSSRRAPRRITGARVKTVVGGDVADGIWPCTQIFRACVVAMSIDAVVSQGLAGEASGILELLPGPAKEMAVRYKTAASLGMRNTDLVRKEKLRERIARRRERIESTTSLSELEEDTSIGVGGRAARISARGRVPSVREDPTATATTTTGTSSGTSHSSSHRMPTTTPASPAHGPTPTTQSPSMSPHTASSGNDIGRWTRRQYSGVLQIVCHVLGPIGPFALATIRSLRALFADPSCRVRDEAFRGDILIQRAAVSGAVAAVAAAKAPLSSLLVSALWPSAAAASRAATSSTDMTDESSAAATALAAQRASQAAEASREIVQLWIDGGMWARHAVFTREMSGVIRLPSGLGLDTGTAVPGQSKQPSHWRSPWASDWAKSSPSSSQSRTTPSTPSSTTTKLKVPQPSTTSPRHSPRGAILSPTSKPPTTPNPTTLAPSSSTSSSSSSTTHPSSSSHNPGASWLVASPAVRRSMVSATRLALLRFGPAERSMLVSAAAVVADPDRAIHAAAQARKALLETNGGGVNGRRGDSEEGDETDANWLEKIESETEDGTGTEAGTEMDSSASKRRSSSVDTSATPPVMPPSQLLLPSAVPRRAGIITSTVRGGPHHSVSQQGSTPMVWPDAVVSEVRIARERKQRELREIVAAEAAAATVEKERVLASAVRDERPRGDGESDSEGIVGAPPADELASLLSRAASSELETHRSRSHAVIRRLHNSLPENYPTFKVDGASNATEAVAKAWRHRRSTAQTSTTTTTTTETTSPDPLEPPLPPWWVELLRGTRPPRNALRLPVEVVALMAHVAGVSSSSSSSSTTSSTTPSSSSSSRHTLRSRVSHQRSTVSKIPLPISIKAVHAASSPTTTPHSADPMRAVLLRMARFASSSLPDGARSLLDAARAGAGGPRVSIDLEPELVLQTQVLLALLVRSLSMTNLLPPRAPRSPPLPPMPQLGILRRETTRSFPLLADRRLEEVKEAEEGSDGEDGEGGVEEVERSESEKSSEREVEEQLRRELMPKQISLLDVQRLSKRRFSTGHRPVPAMVRAVIFHPWSPHVVAADGADGITVWEAGKGRPWAVFRNSDDGAPRGLFDVTEASGGSRAAVARPRAATSSLEWVNEASEPLLVVGAEDGSVRVWAGTVGRGTLGYPTPGELAAAGRHRPDMAFAAAAAVIEEEDSPESEGGEGEQGGGRGGEGKERREDGSDDAHERWMAHGGQGVRLSTAFSALPEVVRGARGGTGTLVRWLPEPKQLVVTGASSVIRVWDLEAERCVQLRRTGVNSVVTCVASAWPGTSQSVVVGCGNGSLRLIDFRQHETRAAIVLPAHRARCTPAASLASVAEASSAIEASHPSTPILSSRSRSHKRWVCGVAIPRVGSAYDLISGSVQGDICFWDLRRSSPLQVVQAESDPMTSLAAHEFAPVIATGTRSGTVKLWDFKGGSLAEISHLDDFAGQRLAPVTGLAFHTHRMLFAAATSDGVVPVYAPSTGDSGGAKRPPPPKPTPHHPAGVPPTEHTWMGNEAGLNWGTEDDGHWDINLKSPSVWDAWARNGIGLA